MCLLTITIDSEKRKTPITERESDGDSLMSTDDRKASTSTRQEAPKSSDEPRQSKKRKGEKDDEEEMETDDENALTNRQNAAKGGRGPKRSQKQRQEELESDEWAVKVEPRRLLCKGCRSWVVLSKSRDFETKDWEVHKKKCAPITGTITVRTRTETKQSAPAVCHGSVRNENGLLITVQPKGVGKIMSFFKKKDSSPLPAQVSTEATEASEVQPPKITYKTKKLPMVSTNEYHKICTDTHRSCIRIHPLPTSSHLASLTKTNQRRLRCHQSCPSAGSLVARILTHTSD